MTGILQAYYVHHTVHIFTRCKVVCITKTDLYPMVFDGRQVFADDEAHKVNSCPSYLIAWATLLMEDTG